MQTKIARSLNQLPKDFTSASRRQFLIASALGLGLSMSPAWASLLASKQKRAVGIQLYTLRDWMAVSVPATLQMIAEIGYKEVEFAGYFAQTPSQIKQWLVNNGLHSPSSHVMLQAMDDNVDKVIEDAIAIGNQYIVIPYLSEQQRGTHIDDYKRLAEKLNVYGERIKKAGIQLAYHNHAFEFEERQNQLPFHILLDETDPTNLVFELDLYWTVKAGLDPVFYFKRNPKRFKLWHVKDMDSNGGFADVGTGTINFPPIFAAADLAGLEHAFVEKDATENKIRTAQVGYKNTLALLNHQIY
jgi:sugar phosphate isomerase/epimerase